MPTTMSTKVPTTSSTRRGHRRRTGLTSLVCVRGVGGLSPICPFACLYCAMAMADRLPMHRNERSAGQEESKGPVLTRTRLDRAGRSRS